MIPIPDTNLLKVLLLVLLAAAMIDVRTYRIPNLITMPFAVGALTYYSVLYGYAGTLFSLAGLGVGLLLLLVPYLLGGLGGGDVKLLGMVGAFLGPKAVLSAFFFIAIVGGIYSIMVVLLHRKIFGNLFTTMRAAIYEFLLIRKILPVPEALRSGRPRLKYGLAIALGTGLFIVTQAEGYTFII